MRVAAGLIVAWACFSASAAPVYEIDTVNQSVISQSQFGIWQPFLDMDNRQLTWVEGDGAIGICRNLTVTNPVAERLTDSTASARVVEAGIAWTPDGTAIVYSKQINSLDRCLIAIARVATGACETLLEAKDFGLVDPQDPQRYDLRDPSIASTPDGYKLVVGARDWNFLGAVVTEGIYCIDIDAAGTPVAGTAKKIMSAEHMAPYGTEGFVLYASPSISADGDLLALSRPTTDTYWNVFLVTDVLDVILGNSAAVDTLNDGRFFSVDIGTEWQDHINISPQFFPDEKAVIYSCETTGLLNTRTLENLELIDTDIIVTSIDSIKSGYPQPFRIAMPENQYQYNGGKLGPIFAYCNLSGQLTLSTMKVSDQPALDENGFVTQDFELEDGTGMVLHVPAGTQFTSLPGGTLTVYTPTSPLQIISAEYLGIAITTRAFLPAEVAFVAPPGNPLTLTIPYGQDPGVSVYEVYPSKSESSNLVELADITVNTTTKTVSAQLQDGQLKNYLVAKVDPFSGEEVPVASRRGLCLASISMLAIGLTTLFLRRTRQSV